MIKYLTLKFSMLNHNYTKMVSQSGVGKYYRGPISLYNSCKLNSYNTVPSGAYLVT
jgi:hypothetical protein